MSRLHRAAAVHPIQALSGPPPVYSDEQRLAGQRGQLTNPVDEEPKEPVERKSKQGFYGYPSTMERIRSAWFHTQSTEDGQPSISELIVAATLGEGPTVAQLEEKHNGGQPFPAVPPGKVRHSRRT